jgi:hypothetical protein
MTKHVELQIENRPAVEVKIDGDVAVVIETVKGHAAFEEEVHIFERDGEAILEIDISTRKALSLVAHRCKEVRVTVHFEHHKKEHHFKPSASINRVLQWAVAIKDFGLDPTQRSKANLMLPGAKEPLSKDDVLAQLVHFPHCHLILELTLKDFTNG